MSHMVPSNQEQYCDAKSLEWLEPYLHGWVDVLKSYIEKTDDSPFQYRERTQVGFFAAASWLLGVPAREEWSTIKGTEEHVSKGRCDLWIHEGDLHIEAKHAWGDVSRDHEGELQRVKKAIDESLRSARWLSPKVSNRLAFTFLTPCIAREQQGSIDDDTTRWLELIQSIECDAIA